jgi:hypothetical protein
MDTSLIQNLNFSKQHPYLAEILEKFKQQIKNIYQEQLVKLIWKQSLNFMLSQFQPLFLSSLINMYDLRFKDN